MTDIVLIAARICPFSHRSWLTALEKQIPFKHHNVDLPNKDDYFKDQYAKAYGRDPNSDGKVPVLVHGDRIVCESDLVSWYIAETFKTGTELIPEDSFKRLKMRRFIDNVPGKLIAGFYSPKGWLQMSEKEKEGVWEKIKTGFDAVESNIEGPYVLGEEFSLADIMLYPWLERWTMLTHYIKSEIPPEYKKIHGFIQAMQSRESVKKAMSEVSNQFYIDGFAVYFQP